MTVRLDLFKNDDFSRGRSRLVEALWVFVGSWAVASNFPGNGLRVTVLRLFGARIGRSVVIKPRVRVKFPWRLEIGDHSWIGEAVWIDNLAQVQIGSHVCVSQGAYLCTGSHDWSRETFDLVTKPIVIGDGAWVCARANVAPGVTVENGAVLGLGATATNNLKSMTINNGNPARMVRERAERKDVG
ncbi:MULTISPECIES: WcaF family extracellular polysaccharide biosynthesis acetyltransferase [unclassified Marinovum]|uniref:WcaF family extracellular polysaccharide biosynthesis acetyltransferase n=1 Tax=unclassified Marinovum TaxID=2647166 RepID=UPI003EDBD283